MDFKKLSMINVQITNPASNAPSVRVSVNYVDAATDLNAAWADLKAEIVAHPQLAGAEFVNETVSGTLSPQRGLSATLTFKRTPAPVMPPKVS